MKLPRLMYIAASVSQVEKACEAGVQLIQLRVKDQLLSTVLEMANSAKEITDSYADVLLIINDYPQVVTSLNLDGVHLGQGDMDIATARELIGGKALIGGTASDLVEVQGLLYDRVDYIGLGPFRFTKTKKNLAPILGIEGYKEILPHVKNTLVFAIGGIELADVSELMAAGVYGIAVSSALTQFDNMLQKTQEFTNQIDTCLQLH